MAVIPISVGIALLAVLWGFFAAKGKGESHDENLENQAKRVKPNLRKDAISLFSNKRYLALMLLISMMALALQPLWVFMIEFVAAVGRGPDYVFRIQFLRCIVEIPLFILVGTACKRVSSLKLLIAGLFFMFVYVLMLLFANSFFWVAAAHLAGGTPGFIFGLTGRLRYINEVTPASVRSTSITLIGTVELGLGAILGNSVAGFIMDIHGTQMWLLVSLIALIVSAAVMTVMALSRRL
jgi:predicted MFS family arabinose efflux permease